MNTGARTTEACPCKYSVEINGTRLFPPPPLPGQHGAGPVPAHSPGVPEGLSVRVESAVSTVEVVRAVSVEVAAQPAEAGAELGGRRQLEEADAVPQKYDRVTGFFWKIQRFAQVNDDVAFFMNHVFFFLAISST